MEKSVAARISRAFLCLGFIAAMLLAAPRALRVSPFHHLLGVAFLLIFGAALWKSADRDAIDDDAKRLATISGLFLIAPFVLIGTLWVGLGPPWEATYAENQMRYVVLVVAALAVTTGFAVLNRSLSTVGERVFSQIGFCFAILSGPLYVIGEGILLASFSAAVRTGQVPPIFVSLSEFQDLIMFFAGSLTYLAAASFALSMRRANWLRPIAAYAASGVSLAGLTALVIRGLQFPDPTALSAPWYMTPGLIAGIPAVPFIVPYLLGVAALRRSSAA